MDHWFWLLIVGGTLVWYVVVTVIVGVKGYRNIREMLEELKNGGMGELKNRGN